MTRTIQSHSKLKTRELCDRLGMSYDTLLRWRRRSRKDGPLLARPGPKKLGPLPFDQVRRDIAALVHRDKRSAGAGALHAKYADTISRRDLNQLVDAQRREQNQTRRANYKRITWEEPNLCWAIDATECGADQNGRKLFVVAATDLCSRHQFEPLPTFSPAGEEVANHLEKLFGRHGRPLVLKRDNGSPFNNASIDALLSRACVIPLNSPARYPRYNGAIEKAIREFKESFAECLGAPPESWDLEAVARVATAAVHLCNCAPRRILEDRSAAEVYHHQARTPFGNRARHAIFEWIKTRSTVILQNMETAQHRSAGAAWRLAVVSWLRCQGLITVSQNQNVLPHFAH